jgi:uncharacterized membrane protein YkvA (DUF1232 family)
MGRYDDDTDELLDDLLGESQDDPTDRAALAAPLPSTGLLSFYDNLRERLVAAASRGRLPRAATETLLVAPDILILLARLTLDRNVPAGTRSLVGGALAYFVMPADLLPEALLGVGGYVDDVVLASLVLAHAFGEDLEEFAERHWSGPQALRPLLGDLARTGELLMGERIWSRLRRVLARRGIAVPAS